MIGFVSSTAAGVGLTHAEGTTESELLWTMVPTNGSVAVQENQNLTMIFNEPVQIGSGTIDLVRSSGNMIIERLSIDSPRVTGWGSTVLTIDPEISFQFGQNKYHVKISDGAILSEDGESLMDFDSQDSWQFTTLNESTDPRLPGSFSVRSLDGTCVAGDFVDLQIAGTNIQDVVVSESANFVNSDWKRLDSQYRVTVQLSKEDEQKTLYVKGRSSDSSISAMTDQIIIERDDTGNCGNTEEQDNDVIVVPPAMPEGSDRLVYVEEINAYYLIDAEGSRHFMPQNHILFSWVDALPEVEPMSLKDLQVYGIGTVMSERPGASLLKFGPSPEIYHVEENPEDRFKPILRHIDIESTAVAMYGDEWKLLITEQSDALKYLYHVGDEINGSNYYIINP